MYNLLVNTEWNEVYCKYKYDRALISSYVKEKNACLDSNKFDKIKNYPALFIYEGFEGVSKPKEHAGALRSVCSTENILELFNN